MDFTSQKTVLVYIKFLKYAECYIERNSLPLPLTYKQMPFIFKNQK